MTKNIIQQLNFKDQCQKYSLPLWECPSFLIVMTGLITILAMLGTFIIANKYTEPAIVALIVIIVTLVMMVINYLIVQSFEKLAEANRLKTEFVSIASHQLRTPLTGIKWAINLMMSGDVKKLDAEQAERLDTIKESNQRMIDLVNDLLNVSRLEQGRFLLAAKKVSLEKLSQELIEEYANFAKSRNIKLSFAVEKNLPDISIDPQAIKLVLHNLIDNAMRYSQEGGQVNVKLNKKKSFIRCEVKDQGVGIPKKDQKKIFQKFFRSQNALKNQTEGTGLGLFIAKSIIDMSKGRIGFQSKENRGSTFWFEIPIK